MSPTSRSALVAAALLLPAASFAEDYPHYKKALEAYQQQIYMSAISEARTQLQETPTHESSWILIARIDLTLKKCPDAGAAAASALNLAEQSPAGSGAELDKILADLDAQCGSSLDVGRAYVRSKNYEKAAEHYRRYLQKNPGDLEARLEFARILSWAKNYPAAAEQYKTYLAARPKETPALLGLADVYAWSGDHRAAEIQLKKVLSRESGNGDALVKLGRVFEWEGDYKSAKEQYDKAVSLSPNSGSAREGLERVKTLSAARRRTTSSTEILAEIEKTGDHTLFLKLGDALYHNEGKVDEALAAYRRYLKEFPEDRQAELKLAQVLGWEKRYDESAALFREYLQKYPDDDAAHLQLANVLAWQGNHTAALSELDGLKQKNPSSPDAYLASGDILRWRRDYPEARENYRKVLELDADNERAQEGLREIERQWSAEPAIRFGGEGVAENDIAFKRTTEDVGADFHLDGGRIDLSPGLKDHQFKQMGVVLQAREAYVNGSLPIQDKWRWIGGVSAIRFGDRTPRLQGSLGIEGTVSTHTWVKMGYTGQDAVFESNNLNALLNGMSLKLNSYDFEFSRALPGDNEVSGLLSAGFLSDGNSRSRVFVQARHQIDDAPIVKVGAAFKELSFTKTSPLYWSPSAYSGPGLTADLERRWEDLDLSYKIGMKLFRITQTSSNEASIEGGAAYRPRSGFFAEVSFVVGRGAGASAQTTTNTVYRDLLLSAGYRF